MKPSLRKFHSFSNEAEERRFWETHDLDGLRRLEQSSARAFPNLKLSTTAISLRLPQGTLDRIKIAANKRDHPNQSLIKIGSAMTRIESRVITGVSVDPLPDAATLDARKERARAWFERLRDDICAALEAVEDALPAGSPLSDRAAGRFKRTPWQRADHTGRPAAAASWR